MWERGKIKFIPISWLQIKKTKITKWREIKRFFLSIISKKLNNIFYSTITQTSHHHPRCAYCHEFLWVTLTRMKLFTRIYINRAFYFTHINIFIYLFFWLLGVLWKTCTNWRSHVYLLNIKISRGKWKFFENNYRA